MSIELTLNSLTRALNRGSLNYTVSVGLWRLSGGSDLSIGEALSRLLGKSVIVGNSWSVTGAELSREVLTCFDYRGDFGAHPNLKALKGKAVRKQLSELESWLHTTCDSAELLVGFWLKEGHPYYPVFWDFAFFLSLEGDAVFLIGSASD